MKSRYIIIILLVAVLAVFGYFLSSNLRQGTPEERAYIERLKADTFGGKTPEDTIRLFVEALNSEDIELATAYFQVDYQDEWIKSLAIIKENGVLDEMAKDFSDRLVPSQDNIIDADEFIFLLKNEQGVMIGQIVLRLNKYTNVWKLAEI